MRTVDEISSIGFELGSPAAHIANTLRAMIQAATGAIQIPVHAIAERAGKSVPATRRWLAALDAAGFIERVADQPADCPQRANIYHWIGVIAGLARHQAEIRRQKHRASAQERRLYNERKREERARREEKARRKSIAIRADELYQEKLRRELEDSGAIIGKRAQQGLLDSELFIPSDALLSLMRKKGWLT